MMTIPKVRTLLVFVFVLFFGINGLSQSTEFAYQGELKDNFQPANGSYDF